MSTLLCHSAITQNQGTFGRLYFWISLCILLMLNSHCTFLKTRKHLWYQIKGKLTIQILLGDTETPHWEFPAFHSISRDSLSRLPKRDSFANRKGSFIQEVSPLHFTHLSGRRLHQKMSSFLLT